MQRCFWHNVMNDGGWILVAVKAVPFHICPKCAALLMRDWWLLDRLYLDMQFICKVRYRRKKLRDRLGWHNPYKRYKARNNQGTAPVGKKVYPYYLHTNAFYRLLRMSAQSGIEHDDL